MTSCRFRRSHPVWWRRGDLDHAMRKEYGMAAGEFFVFVGTYTRGKSEGVHAYRMNSSEGVLRPAAPPAPVEDPMFLALDPANRCLDAVTEAYGPAGDPAGTVSAFSIDAGFGHRRTVQGESTNWGAGCDRPRSRRARARLPEVDAGWWIAAPRAPAPCSSICSSLHSYRLMYMVRTLDSSRFVG